MDRTLAAAVLREQRVFGWRVAFVVTAGFVVAELAAWPLAFIVPLLAVQFLALLPAAPKFRQILVVVVVVLAATSLAVIAGELLRDRPPAYLAVLLATFAVAFYLDNFPRTKLIATMLLLSNAVLPILGMQDSAASAGMRDTLIYGSLLALMLAWLAHAIFPSRLGRGPGPPPMARPAEGVWLRAAILLVPVGYYLIRPDAATFPLVVAVMTILRQADPGSGQRLALGLLLGNLIGGIVATVAYGVLTLFPDLVTLTLVLLAVGLLLGGRIAMGGPQAPVYVMALIVFITLLGIGLPALTSGSGSQFMARFWGVLLGACYAVGALMLFGQTKGAATDGGRASG